MHAYAKVPKTMKYKFSAFKNWFRMNLTSFESHSKPLFSYHKKLYIVHFQNTQKILRENTRFTRNSESKRELFRKTFSSQYFSD